MSAAGSRAQRLRRAAKESAASASEETGKLLNAITEDTDSMLIMESADRAALMAWHSLVLHGVDPMAAAAATIGRIAGALMGANQATLLAEMAHHAENSQNDS